MNTRRWMLGASAILATSLMLGCSDEVNLATGPTPLPQTGAGTTMVRVAHLSPDAPAVDILVDGEVTLPNVPYKAVSDYLEIPSGEHRIQVTPAGDNSVSVIDATVNLAQGVVYTVAATGFLADIQPLILTDDLGTSPGNARVRIVHTSPDAPAVDVALKGGDVLSGNLTFRAASAYIEVPGGVYDLEVRLAGTQTVVLPLDGTQLDGSTVYSVFAIGSVGAGTLEVLPVIDAM